MFVSNASARALATCMALGLSLPGCAPKVKRFTTPATLICPGRTAEVTAELKGDLLLALRPQSDSAGAEAQVEIAVAARQRGKLSAAHRATFTFVHLNVERRLAFRIDSIRSDYLVAHDTLSDVAWPSELRLQTMVARRRTRVTHGGKTLTLAASDTSDAFRGLPINGIWLLQAPRTLEEQADETAPNALALEITATCEEN